MDMQFTDGMRFDTSGPLRLTKRSDGWYVIGNGMLIPVQDPHEANRMIAAMTGGNNDALRP